MERQLQGASNGLDPAAAEAAAAAPPDGSDASFAAAARHSPKLHSRVQGPAKKLALEPSRTLLVRSDSQWRRYASAGAGRGGRPRRSLLGLPLLSPLSRWVQRWDGAVSALDITYTAFLVALSLGFSSAASVDWLVDFDLAARGIYLADLLFSLHVGFVLASWDGRRTVITDGPTSLWFYVRHGYFRYDLLAVLAVIPEVVLVCRGGASVAWKLLYLLRLLRLLRVARLARAVWGCALSCGPGGCMFLFELTSAGMYAVCVLWALAVIVNLLGCFWWWLAEVQCVENSWVEGPYVPSQLHLGDLAAASAPVRWLYSCYFALSTVTTAVYGDVICTTVPEIAVVMAYDFFSVFWWACIVTLIFEVVQASSRTAHKASMLMDRLFEAEGWMQERSLPGDLQQRVRKYYAEVWAPLHAGEDEEQLGQLPASLRGEVVWRMAGATLRSSRLLGALPAELLLFLCARLSPLYVPAGQDLFRQGEDARGEAFLLQSGEACVLRGWRQVASLRAPALLGQAALLGPHSDCSEAGTRLHTVRALTGCSVWRLSSSDLAALLADDPTLLRQLAAAYLQYLDKLAAAASGGPLPPHFASLRRALVRIFGTAPSHQAPADALAAEPAGPEGGRLANGPAGQHAVAMPAAAASGPLKQPPHEPQGCPPAWLEAQRLEAAAASAMQEQPEAALWVDK